MFSIRKAVACTTILLACGASGAVVSTAHSRPATPQATSVVVTCPSLPRSATVGNSQASAHQRRVMTTMLHESRTAKASFRVQVAILAAAMQESGARELPYGHGTSVGPLQLINIHGPARLRQRADFSARWFLPQALRIDRPGVTVAEIAVRVQKPRDRKGYKLAINRLWKGSAMTNARTYNKGCQS